MPTKPGKSVGVSSASTFQPLKDDGSVRNLKQKKRNSTPKGGSLAAGAASYRGCLPADAYWSVPIKAGQRYIVTAAISLGCDSRGWSCDNFIFTRSGPEGVPGYYAKGSLGYPQSQIGSLIGAISPLNAGASMDPTEAARIFAPAFHVGSHRDDRSPIDGFLYLIFNDTWTWADNKGAIEASLQLL